MSVSRPIATPGQFALKKVARASASDFPDLQTMVTAARTPGRDRIAIAGSIAIHLCVLAVLLGLPRPSFPPDDPDERTLLANVIRIEHRPPPHAATPHRAPAELVPVPRTARPVIHAAVTVEHAARKLVVAREQRSAYGPVRAAARPRAAFTSARVAVAAPQPTAAAAAEPAATTAPAASPAPSPVVAQREEGIGNFSETYPASIEPGARGPLFAGVAGVAVRITVDENGRATAVEFLRPPADAALREEFRTRLLAAHFIPAACNGLRCAGTVELRN
jgi:hypothetical protein